MEGLYWIWLQQLFGIGTARSHQMMEEYLSPKKLYEALVKQEIPRDTLATREWNKLEASMEAAKRIEASTLQKKCEIITPNHPMYPPLLQHIYAKPAALYCRGDLSCMQETLPIAIVGTRHSSEYGQEVAVSFAGGLVPYGITIVSGMAYGIDTYAHLGTLEAGGKTIAVLGCGLDIDYPVENAELKTATRKSGAVISEFPMGTPVRAWNFSPRNRVIAGMCRGVLVIEAGEDSGALITANHALDYGREVFVVPGSIFSGKHVGSHRMIAKGKAKLVTAPREMLEEYPEFQNTKLAFEQMQAEKHLQQEKTKSKSAAKSNKNSTNQSAKAESSAQTLPERKPLPEGLDDTTHTVYGAVNHQRQTADQLALSTGLSIVEVLSTLTVLEVIGVVESFPGGLFGLS